MLASCNFDLDSTTLINELDLDILKCICITEIKFLGQSFEKFEPEQDRHTVRRDRTHYHDAFVCGRCTYKFLLSLLIVRTSVALRSHDRRI